jgi:hypothetical protein
MEPGLNEQVATLRYHEFVARELHEQFVASVLPPSASTPAIVTVLRQQLGTLLVRAGQRFQRVHTVMRECLSSVAAGERGTIAS